MHDPTFLALLRNLGWKDEDDKHIIPSKPAKQSGNLSEQKLDSVVTQPANSIQIRASRKSKGEIQRELLGLKRKALVLRRQGETEEAEEVLKMTKVLETELAETEMPKNKAQSEISKPVENDSINFPHKNAGAVRDAPEDGMQFPVLHSLLKNLDSKDDVQPETMQEKSSEQITSISIHPVHPRTEDLGSKNKITYEKREEIVPMNQKPHIDESDSLRGAVYQNDQSSIRKEILILKRKAVALKREGKLAEAREELRQAKLLEKSLEDNNPHPGSSSSEASSSTSNITSVARKE